MKRLNLNITGLFQKNRLGRYIFRKISNLTFPGSGNYWEKRYENNGSSGKGSYGENASYKADFINDFVVSNSVKSVIEFGCGDGNQLKYFNFQNYVGLDVSKTIIEKCKEIFENDNSKKFYHLEEKGIDEIIRNNSFDLSLSLDVVYHLIEDDIFEKYMKDLFISSSKFVIIYAWDTKGEKKFHVRHRNFTKWVKDNILNFKFIKLIKSDKFCDFVIYEKI